MSFSMIQNDITKMNADVTVDGTDSHGCSKTAALHVSDCSFDDLKTGMVGADATVRKF